MKTYRGSIGGDGNPCVTVNRLPLPLRLDLLNHSPSGFAWAYHGSGPAQLALALLADHLGDDAQALDLYQAFKRAVVARLPGAGWTLTSADIDKALAEIRPGGQG